MGRMDVTYGQRAYNPPAYNHQQFLNRMIHPVESTELKDPGPMNVDRDTDRIRDNRGMCRAKAMETMPPINILYSTVVSRYGTNQPEYDASRAGRTHRNITVCRQQQRHSSAFGLRQRTRALHHLPLFCPVRARSWPSPGPATQGPAQPLYPNPASFNQPGSAYGQNASGSQPIPRPNDAFQPPRDAFYSPRMSSWPWIRPKPCLVGGKKECWSINHTQQEREGSVPRVEKSTRVRSTSTEMHHRIQRIKRRRIRRDGPVR